MKNDVIPKKVTALFFKNNTWIISRKKIINQLARKIFNRFVYSIILRWNWYDKRRKMIGNIIVEAMRMKDDLNEYPEASA